MNSTLNYNYYNNPSCCAKEAQLEAFKKINEINMESALQDPAKIREIINGPKKGDVNNDGNIDSTDLESLINYVGSNI